MKRPVIILFLLLVSTYTVFAVGVDDQGNPNDPRVNERANACFEGGSLEGKCDSDWEWIGGWYLIRYEAGLISRAAFPAAYASLLPVESVEMPTVVPPPTYPPANCIAIGGGGYADFGGTNRLPVGSNVSFNTDCSAPIAVTGLNRVYAPGGAAAAQYLCQLHFAENAAAGPQGDNVYTCGI